MAIFPGFLHRGVLFRAPTADGAAGAPLVTNGSRQASFPAGIAITNNQIDVQNLRLTGNTLSSQSGGLTVTAPANQDITVTLPAGTGALGFETNGVRRWTLASGGVLHLGNGTVSASPAAGTMQGTGGSGTNISGATITIAGGQSTGSAAGGSVKIQTSPAGASGSSLNALVDRVIVDSSGRVGVNFTGTPSVRFEVRDNSLDSIGWGSATDLIGNLTWASGPHAVVRSKTNYRFQLGSNNGTDHLVIDTDARVYLGPVTSATPAARTMGATGGSGTNIAGATLNVNSGRSTGSAASGNIDLGTSPAGGSGTTLNAIVVAARIDAATTASFTRLSVFDVDSGLLQRVKVGANNSGPGGSGRALFIDNS